MSGSTRRRFLQTTATASGSLATLPHVESNQRPSKSPKRPNLLFILTDQWRGSALGCDSDAVVRTPHIDQLAIEGVQFRRAYAANPVCTPNRSCLLTGRYSHQTGMITNNLMLPPDEVCWPQLLSDAGYRTHYIGKWHMDGTAKPGFVPPGWRRRGFQTFEGFNRGHIYHRPWGFADDGSGLVPADVADAPDYYEPTFQTDLAMRFMQQKSDQPFACCLSLGPPHTPFRPPADFDRYTPQDIQLRPNVPSQHEAKARRDLAGYYGLCESLDHEVGRLMKFLKDENRERDTLVVFTSDHGELAGSHGKYRKGEPEEESLRVPLIMKLPTTISAGFQTDRLINSIDLMPTLLTLCGVQPPRTCAGIDRSALLDTATPDEKQQESSEAIYTEGKLNSKAEMRDGKPTGAWRCLVTERFKLILRGGPRQVAQFYDLQEDPFEKNNLAADNKHAATRAELTDRLIAIRDQTSDSWPNVPAAAASMYPR